MGYTRLRSYLGGIKGWEASGAPVERGAAGGQAGARTPSAATPRRDVLAGPSRPTSRLARTGGRFVALVDAAAAWSVGRLLAFWLGMVAAFGILYWIAAALDGGLLLSGGSPAPEGWRGFTAAMYFSFVTATSLGYGDVVPSGWLRLPAIVEAASALLIFGFVIAKFISRRQEELTEEIHRIAFEDRLGRVRTNLHLVLSELQSITGMCTAGGSPPAQTLARAESAVMVFSGELRAVHDLLHRPQREVDEEVLEAILASLAAALAQLGELLACIPEAVPRSPILQSGLRSAGRLASEICGECVPREHAPHLKAWMDRIQATSRSLTAGAAT